MFVLQNRSSLKCPNIHRKISVLGSLFNEVAALQTWNFIKKWLKCRCFPVNVVNFLRIAFSIEHHWWLLLIRSEEKKFKWKKKMKTFHLNYTWIYVNIRTDRSISLFFFFNSSFFWFRLVHFLCFHFLQTEVCLFLHLLVFSEAGIDWELFCQTALWQDRSKIVIFFTKLELVFSTVY